MEFYTEIKNLKKEAEHLMFRGPIALDQATSVIDQRLFIDSTYMKLMLVGEDPTTVEDLRRFRIFVQKLREYDNRRNTNRDRE